jgi:hypothetical protein
MRRVDVVLVIVGRGPPFATSYATVPDIAADRPRESLFVEAVRLEVKPTDYSQQATLPNSRRANATYSYGDLRRGERSNAAAELNSTFGTKTENQLETARHWFLGSYNGERRIRNC